MEKSYCSKCQRKTDWLEFDEYWKCQRCRRTTFKRTYEQLQRDIERIQEGWAKLEKSTFLQKQGNKEVVEVFMNDLDHKLYHLRLINGDNFEVS